MTEQHSVEPAQIQADLAALERDGCVILDALLSREECDDLRGELTSLLDRLLLPNYLLSQLQAINILPGEDAQLMHPDDGFYPVPRPRPELSVATIWAIDDFTAENGATVLVPGSHRWPAAEPPPRQTRI